MKTNWPALRNGCLILASLACCGAPLLAQSHDTAAVAPGASVISSVAVTQASARSSVRVEGEGELYARATRMQNPDRLVLDFAGTRMAVQKTVIPGVSAPVRGVRLGQFRPDVARVVIDLTTNSPYQIAHEGSALVISFDTQDSQVVTAAPTLTAAAEVTKPAFHYGDAAPRGAAHHAPVMNVAAPKFALPGELTKGTAFGSFSEIPQPARPEQQAASQQAVQQASDAAATISPMAQQSATAAAAGPVKYTGEPISVNLKDVDLRDFFRLIHEISGLNVVLDPAVKGSLTIVLDEVPWDQALDIVLQNNGLDKQLKGNVLRIATRATLKSEAESVRDLEKAQNDATQPVTVTRVLSYAKATSLTATLKKFMSPKGDILADDRSNQLIIRDIPQTIPVVDNLIHQLDRKSQQVEIEARVVAASRSFARDIGTELGFAGSTTGGRSAFSGSPAVGGSGVTTGPGLPPPPVSVGGGQSSGNGVTTGLPLATNFAAGAPPTSGFGFSHRSPNFAIDFFITAAESKGVGKLLSKPRVVTQNNEKATVKQGTKVPIQTTVNNTVSVQYIDAVLKLEVTPLITAEGTVFMDVLVENTQIDNGIARVQGIPALDTQSAETKVLVADGGTVVIGGIIVTQQQVTITQTPMVGSLPLIGNLFKRTQTTVTSQELLFFLTPRIIPS
ncbi:MAG TPA: type IV pilus secretin PilQ [Candidatus Acidoferrum sp.]|nr:type IV pilus secretin PilQ [Candidatus Acidoferrum sp.]